MSVSLNTLDRAISQALYNKITLSGAAEHHTKVGLFFQKIVEDIRKALGIKQTIPESDKGMSVNLLIQAVVKTRGQTPQGGIPFDFDTISEDGEDGKTYKLSLINKGHNNFSVCNIDGGVELLKYEGKCIQDLYNMAIQDPLNFDTALRPS